MANIIVMLNKEVEKKNLYVDEKGNTITEEKIEVMAKKSYLADLKAGNIDFTVPFEKYHAGVLSSYVPMDAVINVVKDVLKYGECECDAMPDPVTEEPAENVAM
jgi:hypothetical protein